MKQTKLTRSATDIPTNRLEHLEPILDPWLMSDESFDTNVNQMYYTLYNIIYDKLDRVDRNLILVYLQNNLSFKLSGEQLNIKPEWLSKRIKQIIQTIKTTYYADSINPDNPYNLID